MRVLVVDDEEPMRSVLTAAFVGLGHEVVAATDGAEALKHLRGRGACFDLVVTDLQMPRLDGVALMRAASSAGCEMPWILITAEPRSERLAGLDVPVLQKPFRLHQLYALLDQMRTSPAQRAAH